MNNETDWWICVVCGAPFTEPIFGTDISHSQAWLEGQSLFKDHWEEDISKIEENENWHYLRGWYGYTQKDINHPMYLMGKADREGYANFT